MLDQALGWLDGERDSMERLLRELVEISSHTENPAGVNEAGRLLRAHVPLGCQATPGTRYGDQLEFRGARPASQGGTLLLGHLDTVFPKDKFAGYRSNARIAHGPGVLDMKGGLVVIAYALRALERAGLLARIPVSLVVASDEEAGSPESTAIIERVARGARAALVFEAGREGDAILTRRKGSRLLKARALGRAAHSGNDHASGANALWAMGLFVDRLQRLTDYGRGLTVSTGLMSGGVADNVVPDHAEALIDTRFLRVADFEALDRAVREAARIEYVPGTRIEVEWTVGRLPMEKTQASQALFEAYARAQAESGLGCAEHGIVGGGSDGCTTAALGIPTIDGLGPRGKGYHTPDELIELDSLIPKAKALVRYLAGTALR
jgi:glutamate carboxypeptidase